MLSDHGTNIQRKSIQQNIEAKKCISYAGGRLVCEFAYIRQGETESDEVNRFPSGQTHVGFAIYILGCLAAPEEKRSEGDCLRVANVKLQGRQYYSLTALISVLTSRNSAGV